jgi:hypothetical protein
VKHILLIVFVISLFFQAATQIFAQIEEGPATLGVARMVEVRGKDIKDGTVISNSDKGATPTNVAYDPQVMGVVSRDAAILIETGGGPNTVPIISNGKVYILVSSKNGLIKKGDLITSSTITGVAVKADKDGYVLGTALEDAVNTNANQIEKIAADLDLHYFNSKPIFPGSLSDILKIAFLPTRDSPTPIFKYIVAGLVLLSSIILGFMSFGRTAAKGVEALGRNPAASKMIHLGIIFNITIVVVIVLAGAAVAFLILRL